MVSVAVSADDVVHCCRKDLKAHDKSHIHWAFRNGQVIYIYIIITQGLPWDCHICQSVAVVLGVNVGIYGIHGVSGLYYVILYYSYKYIYIYIIHII